MITETIKQAYGVYWDDVKHSADKEGWVYSNDLPHMLDFYFENNTNTDIDFEKSYNGEWRGARWRPISLRKTNEL